MGAAEVDRTYRRARVATAALFLTNGALFAGLLPRYPEIKADLDLSNIAFGAAVAAFPAGALVFGPAAGRLIRRFTAAVVAVVASLPIAVFILGAGLASSWATLAGALFCAGAADAVTDVAQNAHGLRVQRRYGRFIINSFHAVWSVGAILGGLTAAGAIALGTSRSTQLAWSGAVLAVVCLASLRFLLPGHEDLRRSQPGSPRPRAGRPVVTALTVLMVIGFAGAVLEDSGSSWSTLYLRDVLGMPAALAAAGLVAAVGCQFVGRLLGDRMVDRFGPRAVVRAGGLIAAAGMGAALAFPSVPGTIAGFGAVGFGSATLVPIVMHAADDLPGLRPGTGLTATTWLVRLGFLTSPIVVGAVADAAGLRAGLLSVPVAGLVVAGLAGVLSARSRSTRS